MKNIILWGTVVSLLLTSATANAEKVFDYKLSPKKVATDVRCFFGVIEKLKLTS